MSTTHNGFAQGTIPKSKDGSYNGALAFLPDSKLAKKYHTATSPFPDETDPVMQRNHWVMTKDNKVGVRGMIQDAVLLFQWWTLLGDPIEKYGFKWTTSGFYEIMYEEKGQTVTKSIYRSDLEKYPDLLKKFDRIEPYNVNVEITFSSSDIDDEKYYEFRKKYNIMSDLGSAGYKTTYTVQSLGVHYLFAPSGQHPTFILPTMAVGGWPDFLNVEDKKDEERTRRNIILFRLGRKLNIKSFRITDFQWNFGSFIEIARQYERYEKKEDSPKEIAEKAGGINESDGGDDFWNDPELIAADMEVYRDPTTYKYGLKAKKGLRAIPARFNNLVASSVKKGTFFGKTESGVEVINNSGRVVATLNGSNWQVDDQGATRYVSAPDMDCDFNLSYTERMTFENGAFKGPQKFASISERMYLVVESTNAPRPTEAQKRQWEEARKRRRAECYEACERQAASDGYTFKK